MNISFIHWAAADQLWLVALLIAVAAALTLWHLWKTRASVALLNKLISGKRFLFNASAASYLVKAILWMIGFIFLALVLLRPQWDKKEEKVNQQGRDLFIALDISRSMLAKDTPPSRLECAKKKIKALVNTLSCERVGLILFSGSSFISCPLTRDYSAFFMFLDQIDVESISSGTTAIDSAIIQAVQAFQSSARKHKLLVIVTDGENFSPTLAVTKERAREMGLTLFALGAGTTEGAPIPLYDAHGIAQGHQKDKDGTIVISKLNEPLLSGLTQELNGVYLRMSSTDDKDIKELNARLAHFEKEQIDQRTIEHYQEQYPWFIIISFIAFALEWIL